MPQGIFGRRIFYVKTNNSVNDKLKNDDNNK